MQQAAHGVDPGGAALLPLRAYAMESGERLLILALDRDGVNAGAAIRLQERLAVGAVGLVAATVRLDVVRWQEDDLETTGDQEPRPEVRARARLHDDATRRARAPEAFELCAREALPFSDCARPTAYGELEHVLGQIDCDRYCGHGLGSFRSSDPGVSRSPRFHLVREESIPSVKLTRRPFTRIGAGGN